MTSPTLGVQIRFIKYCVPSFFVSKCLFIPRRFSHAIFSDLRASSWMARIWVVRPKRIVRVGAFMRSVLLVLSYSKHLLRHLLYQDDDEFRIRNHLAILPTFVDSWWAPSDRRCIGGFCGQWTRHTSFCIGSASNSLMKHYRSQFQVMGGVVCLVWLKLSVCMYNGFIPLHHHAS